MSGVTRLKVDLTLHAHLHACNRAMQWIKERTKAAADWTIILYSSVAIDISRLSDERCGVWAPGVVLRVLTATPLQQLLCGDGRHLAAVWYYRGYGLVVVLAFVGVGRWTSLVAVSSESASSSLPSSALQPVEAHTQPSLFQLGVRTAVSSSSSIDCACGKKCQVHLQPVAMPKLWRG